MAIQYRTAAELAAGIEAGVRSGRLAPGSRLPTVRALAAEYGLAPGTVAAAFRTLRERGIVETSGRRGTVVRARPPVGARSASPTPTPAGVRDLTRGIPDPALLPPLPPAPTLGPAGGPESPEPRTYGSAAIDPVLLGLTRQRFAADGVPADAIVLTSGALDAIERLLTGAAAPGDLIAVEDPGWGNLFDLIAALGLVPEAVAVDDDGPVPDDVARAMRRGARALILTSRAQNPTGAAVSAERAATLAGLVPPDVLVIEDDHAAEVAGRPLGAVCATRHRLVPDGPWAFVRSVSKPYGPDLRLAVVAADPATVDRVESRQRLGPGWVSGILQGLVVALWSDPDVDMLLATATAAYAARRGALIEALATRGIAAHGRTGVNVWVPVADETAAVVALREAGWAVTPGSRFRVRSGPGIRITVSQLDPAEAPALAAAVAAAVAPASARRGRGATYAV
ncbi:MAG: aminotransferase class I/II-fold pyridoxal phosphate-dependent enzyme [Frankia sp.]